jgi:hypothetical protein
MISAALVTLVLLQAPPMQGAELQERVRQKLATITAIEGKYQFKHNGVSTIEEGRFKLMRPGFAWLKRGDMEWWLAPDRSVTFNRKTNEYFEEQRAPLTRSDKPRTAPPTETEGEQALLFVAGLYRHMAYNDEWTRIPAKGPVENVRIEGRQLLRIEEALRVSDERQFVFVDSDTLLPVATRLEGKESVSEGWFFDLRVNPALTEKDFRWSPPLGAKRIERRTP